MTASLKRTTTRRGIPKRGPLNLRALQMMVRSGVVRRADFDPPSFLSRTQSHVPDDVERDSVKEMVFDQGWLERLLFGHRSQLSVSKRS